MYKLIKLKNFLFNLKYIFAKKISVYELYKTKGSLTKTNLTINDMEKGIERIYRRYHICKRHEHCRVMNNLNSFSSLKEENSKYLTLKDVKHIECDCDYCTGKRVSHNLDETIF